jgi:serine protease DegQ
MRRLWLIFTQAVTVALAVFFVVGTMQPQWLREGGLGRVPLGLPAPVGKLPGATGGTTPTSAPGSLAPAARTAAPSVVSLVISNSRGANPHQNEPWFRRFFGEDEGDESATGMGSAVIVSADGYLLTNHHVIDGADQIEVVLGNGQHQRARVVGTDPESDLAVLKIEAEQLPAIAFGEVEQLQVGDVVLAIGNPFNVGQTVTSGIVSAIGRSGLGLNTFENFIQTDAAINPGNSGGALVDVQGHLLGINTAIYSRSGGSLGIGFAIPATTARQVMDGLIRDGVVMRGWIGVQPSDVTPDLAASLKLKTDHGVLITGVLDKGPAGVAGLHPGDVVLKVGDEPVTNTAQLLTAVAALRPQSQTPITVQRGEEVLTLKVLVAQRPKPVVEPEARSQR